MVEYGLEYRTWLCLGIQPSVCYAQGAKGSRGNVEKDGEKGEACSFKALHPLLRFHM